jgi:hypothetical protein
MGHKGTYALSLTARWCCFLVVDGSMCPLAVFAAHTKPSAGFFAEFQRRSSSERTRGLMGGIRLASAVFPCVT